jgi:hypothetical protein
VRLLCRLSSVRICLAAALFSVALIRLVQAESINQTQKGDINICIGNFNQCLYSCTKVFSPTRDRERYIHCISQCMADQITCINGTVQYVAPGQAPPPRLPPPPTGAPTTTNPISAPIPGPSATPPPNATPPPKPTPTPRRHPIKGPPHRLGPSPSPTAKPILLAKPKPTPSPKPTPKKSSHGHH